jgi:hypothetical protein
MFVTINGPITFPIFTVPAFYRHCLALSSAVIYLMLITYSHGQSGKYRLQLLSSSETHPATEDQKVRWKGARVIRVQDDQRDLKRRLGTTVDTHGDVKNTEAPKTGYRAIVKHRIVAIAHLLVRATTRIRSLSLVGILDVNDEHGFVIAVKYDKEDDGFKVSGGVLGSDMEVETVTAPETIVQEFVVGPIIAALRCGGPGATMFKDSEQTGRPPHGPFGTTSNSEKVT